ncbi:MAG: hypothetical protein Q8M29_02550 [Bacteroidota bacterium]|nr:hypothetical protein [Bacteroidota bacterium]
MEPLYHNDYILLAKVNYTHTLSMTNIEVGEYSVLFTKKNIYLLKYYAVIGGLKEDECKYDGLNAPAVFYKFTNDTKDAASLDSAASALTRKYVGIEINISELTKFVIKNGWFTRGIHMKAYGNSPLKYNRTVVFKGKETGIKLLEFYRDMIKQ